MEMNFKPWYGLILGLVLALVLSFFSSNSLIGNLVFFIFAMVLTWGFFYIFRKIDPKPSKFVKILLCIFSAVSFLIAVYGLMTGNLIILPDGLGSSGDVLFKSNLGNLYFYNNILITLIESGMLLYLAFKRSE